MELPTVQGACTPRRLSIRLDVTALENICLDRTRTANSASRDDEAHVNATGSSSSEGATQLYLQVPDSQLERPADLRNIVVEIDAPEPDSSAASAGLENILSFSASVAQQAVTLARSGTIVSRVVVTIHGDESGSPRQFSSGLKAGSAKVARISQSLHRVSAWARRLPRHLRQAASQGIGTVNAAVAHVSHSALTAVKVVAKVPGSLHRATGRGQALLVSVCWSVKPRAPRGMRLVHAGMSRVKSQASVVAKQMQSVPRPQTRQVLEMAGISAAESARIAAASMKRLAQLAGRKRRIDKVEDIAKCEAKRACQERQEGGGSTSDKCDEVLTLHELKEPKSSPYADLAATPKTAKGEAHADPARWRKHAANVLQNSTMAGIRLAQTGAYGIRKTSRGIATTVNKAGHRLTNVKRKLQPKLIEVASVAQSSLRRGALQGVEVASCVAVVASRKCQSSLRRGASRGVELASCVASVASRKCKSGLRRGASKGVEGVKLANRVASVASRKCQSGLRRGASKGVEGVKLANRVASVASRKCQSGLCRGASKGVELASCVASVASTKCQSGLRKGASQGVELASCVASVAGRNCVKVMGMAQSWRWDHLCLEEQLKRNQDEQTCAICCNTISSNGAVRLKCSHGWYCDTCMLRYSETQIAEGAFQVTCPECRRPIEEHFLRRIVPHKVIDRLSNQSLRQAVAASSDLFACPTPDCPMRVAHGNDGKTFFHCELCSKTCCLRCGVQPYHEGATCSHTTKVQASSDDDERSLLQWMAETGTKQCPTCRIAVSKETLRNQTSQRSECHKMWCRNCGTRFCFKCLTVLTRSHTCGCTKAAHSFVNPHTGKLVKDVRSKG